MRLSLCQGKVDRPAKGPTRNRSEAKNGSSIATHLGPRGLCSNVHLENHKVNIAGFVVDPNEWWTRVLNAIMDGCGPYEDVIVAAARSLSEIVGWLR